MYLTQARLGATQDVEAMIHALAEALPKIDDRTCMVTQLSEVGPIGLYTITRWGNDEAELDGQLSPLEILNQVHGAEIGLEIWQRGMSGLQSAERWTLAYRADLSHPRPADSGSGVEILSP